MSGNTTNVNSHPKQASQTNKSYIAHVRATDKKIQTVETHLLEVAEISKRLAAKINVPEAGVAPRVGAWIETLSAKNAKRKPPIGGSHFDLDGVALPNPNPQHLMQLRFARCGRSFRPEVRGFNQQEIFD